MVYMVVPMAVQKCTVLSFGIVPMIVTSRTAYFCVAKFLCHIFKSKAMQPITVIILFSF